MWPVPFPPEKGRPVEFLLALCVFLLNMSVARGHKWVERGDLTFLRFQVQNILQNSKCQQDWKLAYQSTMDFEQTFRFGFLLHRDI